MDIRIPQSNVPSSVADEAISKEMHNGLGRAITTASSLEAEQGSGNISKTQTKATPSGQSSPRTRSEGNTSRSGEGSMQLLELMDICTKLSDKVTDLENELKSTKAVYNKALITLTKRVKKLEKNLKHKRRREVIESSKDEEASLDHKDSPKQGRMIEEIDENENVNLVQSSKQWEAGSVLKSYKSNCIMVKDKQEKDKIGSKPDKNRKRGEAEKNKKQLSGSFPSFSLAFCLNGVFVHRLIDLILGRYDNRKKRGFFQEYIFQVIRKRFEFKIRRRFFKRCFDFEIGVKSDFLNGGSSVSDSDSEFSSTVIAMNSSNSAKSFSSRMVHSMEWRISLLSSRRASKSSSRISSMTYWNDWSANLTLILVGLKVSRDNFTYKEYGMRLMLAPRSAKALHEKALLKLHGMRKLPGYQGLNHDRGNYCKNEYDGSQTSVRDSFSCWEKARTSPRSQSKRAGGKTRLMKAFRSSSLVSIVPSLARFLLLLIGFGSTIELVSFDESQLVTFNGEFVCGFRNGDYGTGSQSDNMIGSLHGFVIHGIVVLKGNEKVTEVIDVEN
nr:hypothetical protein [Tanacetum cinerariifolium]